MAAKGVSATKAIGLAAVVGLFSVGANAGGGGGSNPCSVSPTSNSKACMDINKDNLDLQQDYAKLANATNEEQIEKIQKDIKQDQADLAKDILSLTPDKDDKDKDGKDKDGKDK